MTRKKLRSGVSKLNASMKRLGTEMNKVDRLTKGRLLNNPLAGAIVPYANAITGMVDYFDDLLPTDPVTHPQIQSGLVAGVSQTREIRRRAPRITGSRGTVTVVHKELIGDVTMSSSGAMYTSATYPTGESVASLNPTNPSLFPWLATIARNYDYFRFKRVRLVYIPLCSTATAGRVMLGFDPDGTDALTYTRAALSSYECSTDSSAWGVQKLDCKLPTNQPWYQTNTPASQAMYSTSTQGQAFWATWGGAAAAVVGELYVLYEVMLKDPQPGSNPISSATGTGSVTLIPFPAYAGAFTVQDLSTDVKLLFSAPGTFRVELFAATTATTAGITVTVAGNATLNFFGKVSDGVNARAYAIVTTSNPGAYDSPGHAVSSSVATMQFGALTALGIWTVNIEAITLPTSYP
jgi:hypothetical protein